MKVNAELYEEDDDREQWLLASLTGDSGYNWLPHEEE
jgi:hypothetical protein